MFIEAQFTIAKCWKQPKYPSANEWIKKLCTFTWWSTKQQKEKELLPFVTAWMELESIMLSEKFQFLKASFLGICFASLSIIRIVYLLSFFFKLFFLKLREYASTLESYKRSSQYFFSIGKYTNNFLYGCMFKRDIWNQPFHF